MLGSYHTMTITPSNRDMRRVGQDSVTGALLFTFHQKLLFCRIDLATEQCRCLKSHRIRNFRIMKSPKPYKLFDHAEKPKSEVCTSRSTNP